MISPRTRIHYILKYSNCMRNSVSIWGISYQSAHSGMNDFIPKIVY